PSPQTARPHTPSRMEAFSVDELCVACAIEPIGAAGNPTFRLGVRGPRCDCNDARGGYPAAGRGAYSGCRARSMATTTVFRNAAWVVAWDEARQAHVYRRGIDVAIRGSEIAFVGRSFAEAADVEVDCTRRLLLPGLVNIHTHPTSEPLRKGITDETRSPGFWHSSLYEFLTVFNNDREGSVAAMQVALAELLMSGVTTVVDLSMPFDGWLDTLAQSGIRAV